MILCHKCAGLLAHEVGADISGLYDCWCISGYVRGFEPNLPREAAITEQIDRLRDNLRLFGAQGRDPSEQIVTSTESLLAKLLTL
jgi:hypothetical protein